MLDPEEIAERCDAYLAAVAASDVDRMLALWAANPRVEDPIGHEPLVGRAAVHEFYGRDRSITRLRRLGPVTVSGNYAAFQFVIELMQEGVRTTLAITDLLEFDEEGQIVSMVGCPSPVVGLEGRDFL